VDINYGNVLSPSQAKCITSINYLYAVLLSEHIKKEIIGNTIHKSDVRSSGPQLVIRESNKYQKGAR